MSSSLANYENNLIRFSSYIIGKAIKGYVVLERNDSDLTALLIRPEQKVNHFLNLLITLVTFGLWAIVWICLVLVKPKEKKIKVYVDYKGNCIEEIYP